MNKIKLTSLLFLGAIIGLSSCTKNDTAGLKMSFEGLEALGPDYEYEGWLIVDGEAISAGIFDIDASGKPTIGGFDVEKIDFEKATRYVLTIEPSPDSDPKPSSVHVVAGDLSNNTANLTVGHGSAIGTDFSSAMGQFILATPTDADMTNENSGVWFLDPSGPSAGLNLPTLNAGWIYEAWAVIDGKPVSTGTFTSVTGSDNAAPFSGTLPAPGFPGEDFLLNAPTGQTFPTDLAGATIVISVEPNPDNSPMPFALKPLVANLDAAAIDHTAYSMTNNSASNNITGTVTITKE